MTVRLLDPTRGETCVDKVMENTRFSATWSGRVYAHIDNECFEMQAFAQRVEEFALRKFRLGDLNGTARSEQAATREEQEGPASDRLSFAYFNREVKKNGLLPYIVFIVRSLLTGVADPMSSLRSRVALLERADQSLRSADEVERLAFILSVHHEGKEDASDPRPVQRVEELTVKYARQASFGRIRRAFERIDAVKKRIGFARMHRSNALVQERLARQNEFIDRLEKQYDEGVQPATERVRGGYCAHSEHLREAISEDLNVQQSDLLTALESNAENWRRLAWLQGECKALKQLLHQRPLPSQESIDDEVMAELL